MKLRLTIIILIIVLTVGSIIITTGFISNSKYVEIPNIYNHEILKNLEYEIKNSDDVNISQINNEIDVINRVINENKLELEQIITKLSQIESNP